MSSEQTLDLFLISEALSRSNALNDEEKLSVTLGEFNGPLDVLLIMARKQKVDLLKISISTLVDQYLAFIKAAQKIRLELAADYLVMAAWLTYLKSALLLPAPDQPQDQTDPELLAAQLQYQIARLDTFRAVAQQLFALPQLDQDFFYRSVSNPPDNRVKIQYKDTLYDLLVAYGEQKIRNTRKTYHVRPPAVMSVEEAIARLLPKISQAIEWSYLKNFLPVISEQTPEMQKSALAGTFVACLELAKRGMLYIKQDIAFDDLQIKSRNGHPS